MCSLLSPLLKIKFALLYMHRIRHRSTTKFYHNNMKDSSALRAVVYNQLASSGKHIDFESAWQEFGQIDRLHRGTMSKQQVNDRKIPCPPLPISHPNKLPQHGFPEPNQPSPVSFIYCCQSLLCRYTNYPPSAGSPCRSRLSTKLHKDVTQVLASTSEYKGFFFFQVWSGFHPTPVKVEICSLQNMQTKDEATCMLQSPTPFHFLSSWVQYLQFLERVSPTKTSLDIFSERPDPSVRRSQPFSTSTPCQVETTSNRPEQKEDSTAAQNPTQVSNTFPASSLFYFLLQ